MNTVAAIRSPWTARFRQFRQANELPTRTVGLNGIFHRLENRPVSLIEVKIRLRTNSND
jgi:hypothetical protein